MTIERTTLAFNKTDKRTYVLGAILWAKLRRNKRIGANFTSPLYRRNLIDINRELTVLGELYAKRHECKILRIKTDFEEMQASKPKKVVSAEQIEKMKAGKRRAKSME